MSNLVYPAPFRGLAFTVTKTSEFDTLVQSAPNKVELRIAQTQNPIWNWQLVYEVLPNYLARSNPAWAPYTDLQQLMGFYLARQGQFDDFLFNDVDDNAVVNQTMQLVVNSTNPIATAVVGSSGGTGFVIGDLLAVTGGGGAGGVLAVANVSAGVITSFTIVDGGSGYATTTNATLQVLTGSGTGSPTANITAVAVYYTPLQRLMGGQFYEDITDLNGAIISLTANGVAKTIGPCGSHDAELHGPGLSIPGAAFMGLYLKWCAQPTPPIVMSFNFYFRVRFGSDTQDFEKFVYNLWTIGGSEGQNGSGTLKLRSSRPAVSL